MLLIKRISHARVVGVRRGGRGGGGGGGVGVERGDS